MNVTNTAAADLEQTLADLVTDAAKLQERANVALLRVRAEGTREITPVTRRPNGTYSGKIPDRSTDELYTVIAAMLKERPMRFAEIKHRTEATDNRIKSVLIRLQRSSRNYVNLGNTHKALWAWVSDEFLARYAK